jgi:tRNA(Ile)-lysidine synthase
MSIQLQQHLLAELTSSPPAPLSIAFSGGPDSTALLHALAQLPLARQRGLRAVHVVHGLQVQSTEWAEHCQRFCASLQLHCDVLRVQVDLRRGTGLEAAARHARHAAFETQLHADEWLVLGHHRDDQAETVLLKLLRGAGPEGLGGMRVLRPFGNGQLWRPLLALSRTQLRAYVEAHQLKCIDDPSNTDTHLARNHLRHEILPRLIRHWPQALDSILHSAALSREAADTLRTQWLPALETLRDPLTGSLEAAGWLALSPALRGPLLDHWLHAHGLSAPTSTQRRQIERQCEARPGQQPCICWPGVELRIWKGRLWASPPQQLVSSEWEASWLGPPLTLPTGSVLSLSKADARLPHPLSVRLRRGGEHIKPAGDRHTRELRDLFQQAMIPPWQRSTFPLLFDGDSLIAVGDHWISDAGLALFRVAGAEPRWTRCG